MNSPAASELSDFHRFVGEKFANGSTTISPEEALDEWRSLHPAPNADEDEIAAIQEAIDDMARGDRDIPVDEFDEEFRKRHNLRPKS